MLAPLLRRTAASLGVMVGASILVFAAIRLVPGDPITAMLGGAGLSDPQLVKEFRVSYGLDEPLPVQYWAWASHVVTGDLGQSVSTREPVTQVVWRRLSATLLLGGAALVVAVVVGLLWGVSGAYVSGAPGTFLRAAPLFVLAVPSFSIGVGLAFVFGVLLRVLPTSGMQTPLDGGSVPDVLAHMVLPALTLALYPAALTARIAHGSIDELRNEDFVRTARAAGISDQRVMLRHILPNTLLPIITNGGVMVGYMLTAAVFVESVFAWPGIGTLMVESVLGRDYPVVQASALIVAGTFVTLSWLIDSFYVLVDPRIGTRR